jgi:hypothetical protein
LISVDINYTLEFSILHDRFISFVPIERSQDLSFVVSVVTVVFQALQILQLFVSNVDFHLHLDAGLAEPMPAVQSEGGLFRAVTDRLWVLDDLV